MRNNHDLKQGKESEDVTLFKKGKRRVGRLLHSLNL